MYCSQLAKLSILNSSAVLIMYFGSVVTIAVVSALDQPEALAAVGLGTLIVNIFGFAVACGLSSVLDTLVAQSRNNPQLCIDHLHKARLLVALVSVPSVFILLHTRSILEFTGQDVDTASLAHKYVIIATLGLPPAFNFYALSSYLRASWNSQPAAMVNAAAAVVHSATSLILVLHFRMAVEGAAVAAVVTAWLRCLLLEHSVWTSDASCGAFCRWLRKKKMHALVAEMRKFLTLAIPSFLLQFCEWLAYELQALIAGVVSVASLAANVVASNVVTVAFMIPMGIAQATSAVVGNALGSGDPSGAKTAVIMSVVLVLTITASLSYALVASKSQIVDFYTSDAEVSHAMLEAMTVIAVFVVLDGLQATLEGALRGMRLQAQAVKWKLLAMIGIRVPVGYWLAVTMGEGVQGIWIGACLGMGFSSVVYSVTLFRADFVQASIEAIKQGQVHAGLLTTSPLQMTTAVPIELEDPNDVRVAAESFTIR